MRRDLESTAGQKAAAAESLPIFEAEAARKRKETEGRPKLGEIVPPVSEDERQSRKARTQAAESVGVNPRYVSDAKKIKEEAPEVCQDLPKYLPENRHVVANSLTSVHLVAFGLKTGNMHQPLDFIGFC